LDAGCTILDMENADLCIIGAGYAGINVLNAACPHLPDGARVVVVDRGTRFGGQWTDQYDYVRLHQPHETFTAHDREWAITKTKPKGHLASKTEILSHFEDIAAACIAEHNIELVTLFNYEYDCHTVEDGKVVLTVNPTSAVEPSGMVAPVSIVATHLFRAEGFNVIIKTPFVLSAPSSPTGPGARVHSLCPADVLTAQWSALMRYSLPDTPIYVIGSGKTAMDILYHLSKREKSAADRLHCIAGRGTW
jgi:cation diffusion facilitator CzcD-associated flavoprotein CzcO